ncbi:MAG TPA: TonB-dependent receptor [Vicinamibacterales bacterium]
MLTATRSISTLRLLLAGLVTVTLVCPARPSAAQTVVTGASLTGRVEDATGGVVRGARIAATSSGTSQRWTTVSAEDGRYRFLSVPAGDYRVDADHDGFQQASVTVTLVAGRPLDLPFTLAIAGVSAQVSVQADTRLVDAGRTQTAEGVSLGEISSLPLNGRNYLDLALLTPGASRTNTRSTERFAETSAVPGTGLSINGQRNLSNTFLVDGLSANDDAAGLSGVYMSEEVIREFQVVSSGGVAEFGRAAAGAVSIITQSGTNRFNGATYLYTRDGALDARNPLAARRDPLTQGQYGLSLGGPVTPDRMFAFGNFEQTRQHRTGLVTISPDAVAAINGFLDKVGYGGPRIATGEFSTGYDTSNVFAKIDRQLPAGGLLSFRYSLYSLSSTNARNAGALNDASRGTPLDNRDDSLSVSLATPLSSSMLNEARAQFTRSRLSAPANDPVGPAVNVSGVASFGTATSSPTARDADVLEVSDGLSWQHGPHLVKAGGDALLNRLTIVFPGALQGVYTFASLSALGGARYINFQQAFGAASQFQSNPNVGLFAQDEWQVQRGLTVNVGLRYDLQWLPDPIRTETGNVSPRLGVAWAPGSRRTVLRASYGLYFDRLPLRAVSNALQRDGIGYKVAVLSFGQAGAPAFPQVLPSYPANVLTAVTTIDPGIQHTRTAQAGFQVERELAPGASLSVTYTHLDGRHIIMSRNVNAPTLSAAQAAALGIANLGRPNPNFGNISRYEAVGASRYDGLTASVTLRSARWGQVRAAYTLSKALDDTGNFFFSTPQDNANVYDDWGPSDNDQRHRFVVSGTHGAGRSAHGSTLRRALNDWQLSYIVSYASALPFNVQTGTDRNNDTTVNDRPAGVGRNTGRGFDSATVDLRVSRRFVLGRRLKIDAVLDAFNVLNRTNLLIPNNVFGTGATAVPTFGRATAAGDPRQLQMGLKVVF